MLSAAFNLAEALAWDLESALREASTPELSRMRPWGLWRSFASVWLGDRYMGDVWHDAERSRWGYQVGDAPIVWLDSGAQARAAALCVVEGPACIEWPRDRVEAIACPCGSLTGTAWHVGGGAYTYPSCDGCGMC